MGINTFPVPTSLPVSGATSVIFSGSSSLGYYIYNNLPVGSYAAVGQHFNGSASNITYGFATNTLSDGSTSANGVAIYFKPTSTEGTFLMSSPMVNRSDLGTAGSSTAGTYIQQLIAGTGAATYWGVGYNSGSNTTAPWVSTDLVTWTSRATITGATYQIGYQYYGGSKYVFGAQKSTGYGIWSSTDTITWTDVSTSAGFTAAGAQITNTAYFGTTHFAVGSDATNARIVTSTDAITWTSRTSGYTTGVLINGIDYQNSTYIITAAAGRLATSTDGITWTTRTTGLTGDLYGCAYVGGIYVTYSNSGSNFATSTDAITWTVRTRIGFVTSFSPLVLGGVAYAGNFVSTDGLNWYKQAKSVSRITGIWSTTGTSYDMSSSGSGRIAATQPAIYTLYGMSPGTLN